VYVEEYKERKLYSHIVNRFFKNTFVFGINAHQEDSVHRDIKLSMHSEILYTVRCEYMFYLFLLFGETYVRVLGDHAYASH
jgi:hypothetical protein